ncbi:MAG TPA: hypothetical protein PKE16_08275 [Hyphomicrobium sp.]|nr:hypothetical protein [Hyphomicrobium sp.]
MFSTKLVASALVVLASASSVAGVDKSGSGLPKASEIPVALDSNSLLVATLANGEIQTQWMSREACEHVASAVTAGDGVAGVRQDGVRIYIAQANCSTRRIEVDPAAVRLSASQLPE